jgi:hypothetical protein
MTMTGCMGGIGLSGITGGDSATGADDITGGNNASEDSDSGDSGTATEPESAPVATMPGAYLQGGSLAFKSDSGDNVPVVGLENAIADFADGDQVIISDIELEAEVACLEKGSPAFAQGYGAASLVKKISNLVISEAHAEETAASICDDEDKKCCPIQDDGSFECFYPLVDQSVASVFISVVDEDGNYVTDEVTEETIQPNLMYVQNAPSDVAALDGSLFSLGNSKGTSFVTDTESELRVDEYEKFEAEGSKLGFSSNDDLVGVLDDAAGIRLYDKAGDDITDTGEIASDESASSYTFMRTHHNVIYYGFEQEANLVGYIDAAARIGEEEDGDHDPIMITTGDDGIFHTKTLAYTHKIGIMFDDYTSFAFVDDSSNIRLRTIKGDGTATRYDGAIWKTTEEASVKDLVSYYDDDSDKIYLAVLDNSFSKLYVGNFSIATETTTLGTELSLGSTPTGMVYSENSGKLYILNQGSKNINIVKLMEYSNSPLNSPTMTTIELDDYITGLAEKGITLSPNSVSFTPAGDSLVVGDATTRGVIEVDISELEVALEESP